MFRARAAREPMITARVRPNTMANWHARGRSVWYPICQSIDLKVEKKIEDSLHIPTHPYTSLHIPTPWIFTLKDGGIPFPWTSSGNYTWKNDPSLLL